MSTPHEKLHELIDELSDETAADLLPELRLLKLQAEAQADKAPATSTWPPSWFGSVEGSRPDFSEHIDEMLATGFEREAK